MARIARAETRPLSTGSTRRKNCRLCASGRLELVIQFEPTPIADAFVPEEKLGQVQTVYPLDLALCLACGHLQLLDVVDPEILFSNYIYVSSSSPGLEEHFKKAAEGLAALAKPGPGDLAVDIGSNDGTLLRFLKDHGLKVLGVDPAREIARKASESGVQTLAEFFGSGLARRIRADHGPAKLVTANNVFAHSDALADMADGVRLLLAEDGIFVFEVGYLVDMIEQMVFDWVYHEHLSYHSVKPLVSFLADHGLELVDARRIPTKGGSLRCVAQLTGGPRKTESAVAELLALEKRMGLDEPKIFRDYAAEIDARKKKLLLLLDKLAPKNLAGYGASPTVTTLLYHFDLGRRIKFLVDDNPVKQGRFSPGHHIPVLPPAALAAQKPDCVVILAWRFVDLIVKKNRAYLDAGGKFIAPLPDPRIL